MGCPRADLLGHSPTNLMHSPAIAKGTTMPYPGNIAHVNWLAHKQPSMPNHLLAHKHSHKQATGLLTCTVKQAWAWSVDAAGLLTGTVKQAWPWPVACSQAQSSRLAHGHCLLTCPWSLFKPALPLAKTVIDSQPLACSHAQSSRDGHCQWMQLACSQGTVKQVCLVDAAGSPTCTVNQACPWSLACSQAQSSIQAGLGIASGCSCRAHRHSQATNGLLICTVKQAWP